MGGVVQHGEGVGITSVGPQHPHATTGPSPNQVQMQPGMANAGPPENPVDAFFEASRWSREDVMLAAAVSQLAILAAVLFAEVTA